MIVPCSELVVRCFFLLVQFSFEPSSEKHLEQLSISYPSHIVRVRRCNNELVAVGVASEMPWPNPFGSSLVALAQMRITFSSEATEWDRSRVDELVRYVLAGSPNPFPQARCETS